VRLNAVKQPRASGSGTESKTNALESKKASELNEMQ
jgi:hypothetical protein